MKTLLILTILAMATTIATANMQVDPSGQVQWPQQQPFPQPQQPFCQQPQRTIPQPHQTFHHQPQQTFPQPQQTYPHQPQQQFPQTQQPQQPFPQPQQTFPQQPQLPFPQQPQQPAQLEGIRSLVLKTLPTMCNVYVPPDCSTINVPYANIDAGIGGQ
uniref:Gamma gliadin n=1 Tax=Triticum turgidum subsp. turgidum TaxID=357456 RepID=F6KV50_TRITU|nr:gamma gliadin [Triticum turgidum subsp. turgidum]